MKRVLSIVLALLMVVGTMAIMPLSTGAAEADAWDGAITKPTGIGTKEEPYIIDEPGDLAWFGSFMGSIPRVVGTLGTNHTYYMAQYESYYEGQDTINGMNDLGNANTPGFEYSNNAKKIDFTQPMVALTKYDGAVITADMNNTWEWGSKIYVRQVCDIDLNGKTILPMAYYWSYNNTSAVKGAFFNGEYDGQGYTIKNGTVAQSASETGGGNDAWTAGLFGVLWGATVKNIVFDNFHAASSEVGMATAGKTMPGIGLLASRVLGEEQLYSAATAAEQGETTITNIKVLDTCSVTSTSSRGNGVGGLVGKAENVNITSCVYLGKVNSALDDTRVGGIVGVLVPKNSEVTNCYFGGEICILPKTGNAAVATDAVKLAAETHLGGIVGNWAGTFTGTNKLSNNVNNGRFTGKADVDGTAVTVTAAGNNFCHGGILGAASQLAKGTDGTIEFKSNYNLADSNYWAIGDGRRVGSIIGCYYTNTASSSATHINLTMEDCHTVNAWNKTYDATTYPQSEILKGTMRYAGRLLESGCSVANNVVGNDSFKQIMSNLNELCFQGKGTVEDPYKIGSVGDWFFFAGQIGLSNGGQQYYWNDPYEDKYFIQTADIDFDGARLPYTGDYLPYTFSESGKYNQKGAVFGGHYDGQGYAMKNAVVPDPVSGTGGDNWGHGLFGAIYGATIKNLVLDNVSTYTNSNAGLLVGVSKAPMYDYTIGEADSSGIHSVTTTDIKVNPEFNVIENIVVKDNCVMTNSASTDASLAGIVAVAAGTTIRNCYSGVTIEWAGKMSNWGGFGGLVGQLDIGSVVENCISNATLNYNTGDGANTQEHHCGNVVGITGTYKNALTPAISIKNCVNLGSFNVTGTKTGGAIIWGGILGGAGNLADSASDGLVIENCYNMGKVTTSDGYVLNGEFRIGGIVGCYWTGGGNPTQDHIILRNCSTVDMGGVNTCWYGGKNNAYNFRNESERQVKDNGTLYAPIVAENNDGSTLNLAAGADKDINEYIDPIFVEFAEARDALNCLGYQTKTENDGLIDVRVLYEMEALNLEEFGEIRYNVTMNGVTKTVSENVVYTAFTSYADGATTPIGPSTGMAYMSAFTLTDIPTDEICDFTIEAILVKVDENGNECSITRALDISVNVNNGVVTAK